MITTRCTKLIPRFASTRTLSLTRFPGRPNGCPGIAALTNGKYSHQPVWYLQFPVRGRTGEGFGLRGGLGCSRRLQMGSGEWQGRSDLQHKDHAAANWSNGKPPLEWLNQIREVEQNAGRVSLEVGSLGGHLYRAALPERGCPQPQRKRTVWRLQIFWLVLERSITLRLRKPRSARRSSPATPGLPIGARYVYRAAGSLPGNRTA